MSQRIAPPRRLATLRGASGRPAARAVELLLWGGERRERILIGLLRRHYESVFRRQWVFADEQPHYFDHRIGSFAFATGMGHPFSYFRGFFAAEMIRDGDVLLDIGCGDGFFARRFFAPKCAGIDAVDITSDAIAHASHFNAAPNIRYFVLDAVTEPFPRERYDVVVLDGALGHFEATASEVLLGRIADALTESGVFVGSESLGVEGDDHLQYFETLGDLAARLKARFAHVQLRKIDYVIPSGAVRREAFWRCANQRLRLDEAAWTSWDRSESIPPASAVS